MIIGKMNSGYFDFILLKIIPLGFKYLWQN
jgi:hypothetical protein